MADGEGDDLCLLPCELIMHVLKHLSAHDIIKVSQCCKTLYEVARIDSLWQHLCYRDYHVVSKEGWEDETSFHILYTKVLYKYYKFLGLWNFTKSPYGMLLHIKMERGQIAGYNSLPPPDENVRGPLHCGMCLFCVVLEDSQCVVLCRERHHANLKMKDVGMSFRCELCEQWARHAKDVEFQESTFRVIQSSFGEECQQHNLINKLYRIARSTRHWSKYKLGRVPLPQQSPVVPVRLGVYKGTYGAHGLELVNVTLASNGYQLLGKKLLGDPNVPSGEVSLYVDLRSPMVLTEDQQRDLAFLKNFKPQQLPEPYQVPADALQPFEQDAISFLRFEPSDVPNTCRARFLGEGRIAGHGYMNPSFSKAHFVVFGEEFFGFFWLDLHSFSIFHRVKENLW